ncbi:hypothetical protein BU16DRAFT_558215 [Lophium mytilinum]|uniref:RING-type domain-containing protein n=1 Tax=Lophium mytilinum TaxID=390894 RepID=A0A6A6R0U9_9PEZI|nr:hypothetical protein BU16DRAFT_558215 [Lophium mytilinum]
MATSTMLPLTPEAFLCNFLVEPDPGNPALSEDCPICHQLYDEDHFPMQITQTEGCKHIFGLHCLTNWLTSNNANNNTCPLCRTRLYGLSLRDEGIRAQVRLVQSIQAEEEYEPQVDILVDLINRYWEDHSRHNAQFQQRFRRARRTRWKARRDARRTERVAQAQEDAQRNALEDEE